ncbi:MAG: phosphatidylserine decarboxylase [Chromatiaceae bacterium]|jgi:hypothetical protein|nr:phosphatidylserine decarboxylase [Chromatiaceae bacterium]
MAQVSSVTQTPDVDAELANGEEFSFFQFGGSDILLLFQPDRVRLTAEVDKHGLDAWDQRAGSRCFVHVTSSLSYFAITGSPPPHQPPAARQYTSAGLHWFEYYAADKQALEGAAKLAGLDSVAAMKIKKGEGILGGNEPVMPHHVVPLGSGQPVREGEF